jgi:hypothetical protein
MTAFRRQKKSARCARLASKVCQASHSMPRDRSILCEEAKQREPSYDHYRNMATFMAPDSCFIWRCPVIWLGSHLVLVVVAFCRVRKRQPLDNIKAVMGYELNASLCQTLWA